MPRVDEADVEVEAPGGEADLGKQGEHLYENVLICIQNQRMCSNLVWIRALT